MRTEVDVAIIGGGPAGSTLSGFLKKYNPALRVTVFEKEKFPREHVGESHLPIISAILHELGVWDKVEAAGFPIKLGASYRWGNSPDLWDFEFIPFGDFVDEPRPAKYQGQRLWTAFQVERSIYDQILLDPARELGVDVREETTVAEVRRGAGADADRCEGFVLGSGEEVVARHYCDCSGHVGVLRRAMGVETQIPTKLKNVAMWDYWENAEWAVEIGTGATRVFVLSIGAGWIWFIPLGPTRTSIGFICPAEWYKKQNKTPKEVYDWAIAQEPLVQKLTRKATRENEVRATKDWSFLSDRMVGANWFLAGECAGFADPILAAGMTLAHAGARELAYTILELERGEHDAAWLKERYETMNRRRIGQHIRFADFWYSANGCFTDIEEYTTEIARTSGIKLDPKQAFQWIANGGFLEDIPGRAGVGGLDMAAAKKITEVVASGSTSTDVIGWKLNKFNVLHLNLTNAREEHMPILVQGRIRKTRCYIRENRTLTLVGHYATLVELLGKTADVHEMLRQLHARFVSRGATPAEASVHVQQAVQCLEVMLMEGWVWGQVDPKKPMLQLKDKGEQSMIHKNRDVEMPAAG